MLDVLHDTHVVWWSYGSDSYVIICRTIEHSKVMYTPTLRSCDPYNSSDRNSRCNEIIDFNPKFSLNLEIASKTPPQSGPSLGSPR
jgi:hypothetical protein